jgi:hypothetical protein
MARMLTPLLAGLGCLAAAVVGGAGIERMIIRVALEGGGTFAVEIENPAATPLSSKEATELALEPEPRPETQRPYAPSVSYRAPVDLSGDAAVAATAATPLEVPASSKRQWRGRVADLAWHRKEAMARLGSHQLSQVVPVGRYKLSFWVGGWASNQVDVLVHPRGRVTGVEASQD